MKRLLIKKLTRSTGPGIITAVARYSAPPVRLWTSYPASSLTMDEPRKGVCIRSAGNTEIPALLALRAKGYRVWLQYMKIEDPKSPWHPYMPDYQARSEFGYFSATTAVELLGLVAMWETRGDDWKFKADEPDILNELMDAAKTFDGDGNELPDE